MAAAKRGPASAASRASSADGSVGGSGGSDTAFMASGEVHVDGAMKSTINRNKRNMGPPIKRRYFF
jgi:hypothetical protein